MHETQVLGKALAVRTMAPPRRAAAVVVAAAALVLSGGALGLTGAPAAGASASRPATPAHVRHDGAHPFTDPATSINAAMTPRYGAISGRVTTATGTNGLAGICVAAGQYGTVTGTNGTYTITDIPAGASYDVGFSASGSGPTCLTAPQNYVAQTYPDTRNPSDVLPVSVTATHTTSGIDAELAESGTISGTVTTATGTTGLEGICVIDNYGTPVPPVKTGTGGTYSITGLPAGTYKVAFAQTAGSCYSNGGYAPQWYPDMLTWTAAGEVTVTAGGTTGGIDAEMTVGGTIRGTVTTPEGNGLEGICVSATGTGALGGVYIPAVEATTSDGAYSITGLPAGTYDVEFGGGFCLTTSNANYIVQWYSDASSRTSATKVSVSVGRTTETVDAQMAVGGTISGTVTDFTTGQDLGGICVVAFPAGSSNHTVFESAGTTPDGKYSIKGLATGTYDVEFGGIWIKPGTCPVGNYETQWYGGESPAATQTNAVAVPVTAGAVTSPIDAAMIPKHGRISGTVTAATGGAPLGTVCVRATETNGSNFRATTKTASDGTYTITVPAGASYAINFTAGGTYCSTPAQNYVAQTYPQPVSVNATQTTSGINAELAEGGTISGTVTAAATEEPLKTVCVLVNFGSPVGPHLTGTDGTYRIPGLPAGSYKVTFYGTRTCTGNEYATQWYPDEPSFTTATAVSVTVGNTTLVDAAMAIGGSISGTLTSPTGHALEGVCVNGATGPSTGAGTMTGTNGTYTLGGLWPGTYKVWFISGGECPNGLFLNYISKAFPGRVVVSAGSTISTVDMVMAVGGTISGTVTDAATGAALGGICVLAYPVGGSTSRGYPGFAAATGDGTYTVVGLATGAYDVEFLAKENKPGTCTPGDYVTQWYRDAASKTLATAVLVSAPTSGGSSGGGSSSTAPSPPPAPPGSKTVKSGSSSTPRGTVVLTDGTELSVVASGEGAVTVAKFSTNPATKAAATSTGIYVDIQVASGSQFTSLTFTVCGGSTAHGLDWWNGSTWLPFSDQKQVPTEPGCITAFVTATTSPTLTQLTGTVVTTVKAGATATRIAGPTADATAAKALETEFPGTGAARSCVGGKVTAADTRPVVLATTKTFPDALAASYLAASLDTGLLLTPTTQLSAATAAALQKEGVTRVVVVGGTLAVSASVAEAIASMPAYTCGGGSSSGKDITVTRIGGATAYDTAEMIAETPGKSFVGEAAFSGAYSGTDATKGTGAYNDTAGTGSSAPAGTEALRTAILATGASYQDAMTASAMAYGARFPLVLTSPTSLSAQAASAIEALTVSQVIVMGGPFAVSNSVVSALGKLGVSVLRVAGKDATDTAVELASFELASAGTGLGWPGRVSAAVGRANGFADGLSGSVVTGRTKLPLLLTENQTTTGAYLTAFLKAAGQSGTGIDGKTTSKLAALVVFGGSLAITTTVVSQMKDDIG